VKNNREKTKKEIAMVGNRWLTWHS